MTLALWGAARLAASAAFVLAFGVTASQGASCGPAVSDLDTRTEGCYSYIAVFDFGADAVQPAALNGSNGRQTVAANQGRDIVPLASVPDEGSILNSTSFGFGGDDQDLRLQLISDSVIREPLAWVAEPLAAGLGNLGLLPLIFVSAGDYAQLLAGPPFFANLTSAESAETDTKLNAALVSPAFWFAAGFSGVGLLGLRRRRFLNRHLIGQVHA
jgi:hypothetical protein